MSDEKAAAPHECSGLCEDFHCIVCGQPATDDKPCSMGAPMHDACRASLPTNEAALRAEIAALRGALGSMLGHCGACENCEAQARAALSDRGSRLRNEAEYLRAENAALRGALEEAHDFLDRLARGNLWNASASKIRDRLRAALSAQRPTPPETEER